MFYVCPSGDLVIELDDIKKLSANETATGDLAIHRAIYQNRPDVNAVITNHSPYCVAVAKTESYIPATLDDMAQIIGYKAMVARSADVYVILKDLKKSGACLIKDGGVIATGRTLDEAHTSSLVLEKGAKAFVEATVLGGAKKISWLDAHLMRFVYKKKYSKADQTAKMEELSYDGN
jgi:L-fuculose-phosphate aldolase